MLAVEYELHAMESSVIPPSEQLDKVAYTRVLEVAPM